MFILRVLGCLLLVGAVILNVIRALKFTPIWSTSERTAGQRPSRFWLHRSPLLRDMLINFLILCVVVLLTIQSLFTPHSAYAWQYRIVMALIVAVYLVPALVLLNRARAAGAPAVYLALRGASITAWALGLLSTSL